MTLAYHFCGPTLRDGRPIPADGEWLVHEGRVEICKTGLHASRHPFDALQYAPGATLCLVECEDIVTEQDDKFVCRRRMIVKRIDATDLLWEAARRFALSVIHLWDAEQVVKDFLETGNESLRATWATRAASATWATRAASAASAASAARAAQRDLFARLVSEAMETP